MMHIMCQISSLWGLLDYVTLYLHESPKCEDVGEGLPSPGLWHKFGKSDRVLFSIISSRYCFDWKEWYNPMKNSTDCFLVFLIQLLPYYLFSSTSLSLLSWDLPNPGIKPRFPALPADSLPAEPQEKRKNTGWVDYPFSRGCSWPRNWTGVSWIAGRFFTNWAIREALLLVIYPKNWKLVLTQILIWHRS